MAEIDFPGAATEWQGRIYDVGGAESRIPFRIGLKNLPGPDRSKGPVLLVHGASAASRTFEVSARASDAGGGGDGLAGFLRNRGWDVWLLDWRSSGVLAPILMDDADRPLKPDRFNLDEAQDDLIEATRAGCTRDSRRGSYSSRRSLHWRGPRCAGRCKRASSRTFSDW